MPVVRPPRFIGGIGGVGAGAGEEAAPAAAKAGSGGEGFTGPAGAAITIFGLECFGLPTWPPRLYPDAAL